jgi:hypothetical protein
MYINFGSRACRGYHCEIPSKQFGSLRHVDQPQPVVFFTRSETFSIIFNQHFKIIGSSKEGYLDPGCRCVSHNVLQSFLNDAV